jgi:integrase
MKARFQNGWVRTKRRSKGEVWYFEWRDYTIGGKIRSLKIGPVSRYKTESDAWRAVELKRLDINAGPEAPTPLLTVGLLISHYLEHELKREDGNASSTKDGYESYLNNHIVPAWRDTMVSELRPIAIENWLRALECKPRKQGAAPKPMSAGTRAKIRSILHAIFDHGLRYELVQRNPVTLVRQGAKRQRIPEILTVDEFRLLLLNLNQRERVMVLLAAGTGLRRSELFALKWLDVNYVDAQIDVRRSVIHNTKRERMGECKTEASRKPVPLDPITAAELLRWHDDTTYNQPDDWIFASHHTKGKWPFWPQTIMKRFVRPAAKKAEIAKRIGWHTFRHSYCTLLRTFGTDVKVMQELMRHANFKTTMDGYNQAMMAEKREAQARVVRALVH